MAGEYPDTTLYRPPTTADIAKRRAAAVAPQLGYLGGQPNTNDEGAYPDTITGNKSIIDYLVGNPALNSDNPVTAAQTAARTAATKVANSQPSTPLTDGPYPDNVRVGTDVGDGIKRYSGANGPTFTNMGDAGVDDLARKGNPLPSVASFLRGVPTFGQGAGAGPGGSYVSDFGGRVNKDGSVTPAGGGGTMFAQDGGRGPPTLHDHIADLNSQAQALSGNGTLKGRVQGAVLARRANALLAVTSQHDLGMQALFAHAQQAQGTLGLGYAQLAGTNVQHSGDLALRKQIAGPLIASQIASQRLATQGDYNGAYAAMAAIHGINPNPMHVTPTMTGGVLTQDASGHPRYNVDALGNVTEYPDTAFPKFQPIKSK